MVYLIFVLLFVQTCYLICVDSQKHKKVRSKLDCQVYCTILSSFSIGCLQSAWCTYETCTFQFGYAYLHRPIMMEENEEGSQQIIKKGVLLKRQRGLGLHFWSSKKFQEKYCILFKKSLCYNDGDQVRYCES